MQCITIGDYAEPVKDERKRKRKTSVLVFVLLNKNLIKKKSFYNLLYIEKKILKCIVYLSITLI
jgi:hypothetical protein